jgi:mannosyltransferase OCH1-like enzyme
MRWEILYTHGGVVFDADSIALRPLDDHLLDCEAFACWENEIIRPGLVAAGYFGSVAGNPFLKHIIEDIAAEPSVVHEMAWKTVGPQRLTDAYRKYAYSQLRVYPSHYFIPQHFTGLRYQGQDAVYAHQIWGSTRGVYADLHQADVSGFGLEQLRGDAAPEAPSQEVAPASPVAAAPVATPPVETSALERLHEPYFVQKVQVSSEIANIGRLDVFANMCRGKRVLHIGCADWPITDPATSLHLALEPYCEVLDGFDVHEEALAQLAPLASGKLFSRIEDVTGSYDVVLVPEVMEHVANVPEFLAQLQAIDAGCYFISVPDAFQCRARHFDYVEGTQTFVEVVHPDHNVWYTPYTFSNTIAKYSDFKVEQMWFFNNISILALLSKPQMRLAA